MEANMQARHSTPVSAATGQSPAQQFSREAVQRVSADVTYLRTLISNVFFIGAPGARDREWTLVDAGLPGFSGRIERLDTGPTAGADREDGQERQAGAIARSASQLQLLPQNTRYFQYNGLPMVLFGNQAGLAPTPTATFDPGHLERVRRHGNALFTAAHPTWVDASHEELLATLNDDAHWANLGEIARVAYAQDVILHVYFWSYKWNFQGQGWTGSDMIWSDPAQDGGEVVDGLTRKDLHDLLMDRALEATWQSPNGVCNMMWEYNTRVDEGSGPQAQFDDRNGDFHRWWIGELRERGISLDPAVHHLIATTDGRAAPGDASATFGTATTPDFIVEEDGNGCWYSHETGRETLLDYHVPLVFMSRDYAFA